MPKGSAPERLKNIQALGADACITELNYDDAVRHANEMTEKNGWIMVQDTAWDGSRKFRDGLWRDILPWLMRHGNS